MIIEKCRHCHTSIIHMPHVGWLHTDDPEIHCTNAVPMEQRPPWPD